MWEERGEAVAVEEAEEAERCGVLAPEGEEKEKEWVEEMEEEGEKAVLRRRRPEVRREMVDWGRGEKREERMLRRGRFWRL